LQEFANDLETVISRAASKGIDRILVPGIDLETSRKSIILSEKYSDSLFAAIGIHPNESSHFDRQNLVVLKDLLQHPKVVAIGEIGLDFFRERSPIEDQISIFSEMLDIAKVSGKPICIHNRNADYRIIEILDAWYSELSKSNSALTEHPGVFHSFTGSEIISEWALTHNFYLGIGGPITYPKNQNLRDSIEEINIENLIIETDSPYLPPQQYRGKRNEPCYVKFVAEKIAEIKKMELSEVIHRTSENAKSLFKWE
jgi:TatD DNase family protein